MKTITTTQLAAEQKHTAIDLIDVRMPFEYRQTHVECARNVPLGTLDPKSYMESRPGTSERPLYVICQGGNRSAQACKKFADAGFDNVVSVEGGTLAWDQAGLPVIRGKRALPLMQQVQIAAGSLVVLGVVLSYVVHPYFVGLSAFVGAGLVFAGASGLCPMATLIGKMPWNRDSGGGSCSVSN